MTARIYLKFEVKDNGIEVVYQPLRLERKLLIRAINEQLEGKTPKSTTDVEVWGDR